VLRQGHSVFGNGGMHNGPKGVKSLVPRGPACPGTLPHEPNPFPQVNTHDTHSLRRSSSVRRDSGLSPLVVVNAIPCPPCSPWPVVRCVLGIGPRVPSPNGGRNDGTGMAQALGFVHDTPCAATLHTVFRLWTVTCWKGGSVPGAERSFASHPTRLQRRPRWHWMAKHYGAHASRGRLASPVIRSLPPRRSDTGAAGRERQNQ